MWTSVYWMLMYYSGIGAPVPPGEFLLMNEPKTIRLLNEAKDIYLISE